MGVGRLITVDFLNATDPHKRSGAVSVDFGQRIASEKRTYLRDVAATITLGTPWLVHISFVIRGRALLSARSRLPNCALWLAQGTLRAKTRYQPLLMVHGELRKALEICRSPLAKKILPRVKRSRFSPMPIFTESRIRR